MTRFELERLGYGREEEPMDVPNANEAWLVNKLAEEGMLEGVYQEALALLALPAGPYCRAPFPGDIAGTPILCDLTVGHGGGKTKCYNRELRLHWWSN